MKYIDSCLRKMLAAAVLFAVTGCISLDEDIDAQPTSDKFFDETEDYYNFLMSGYTSMIQLYGSDELYCLGAAAEDIYVPIDRWKGFEYADINSVGNPDELTNNPWNLSYKTIGICNTMLQIVRDSDLSPAELAPIVGEAKFLRALAYFNMTRWFKEVPLITEDNMTEAATHPDTPVADIYAQIVSDLTAAEGSLPDGRGGEDFFRPTSWAAKALLSKVYLTMAGYPLNRTEYYALARDKAWEVISPEKFDLEPVYFDLWLWNNRKTNKEFIFTFFADWRRGDQTYVNCAIRPWEGGEGGWGDWSGDKRFLEEFPEGDGSRVKGTFYLTLIDGTPWYQTADNQPFVGKLRDAGENSGGYAGPWSYPNGNADGFFSVIRFSEVLLIYAEAANLAEGKPSTEAYEAVNRVRRRAGLGDLEGLNQAAFDKAVLDERKWELTFENHRWFDICRRQLLPEVIGRYYPERQVDDHNYWMPKPHDQFGIMTGIKQNEGYL